MQYLLLIYASEEALPTAGSDEQRALFDAYREATRRMIDAGVFVAGDALQSIGHATTVRRSSDQIVTTDGPFAETREQLGGYYLVECRDRAQAEEVASWIPVVDHGCVEVRPILQY